MTKRAERLTAENVDDFFKLHSGECGWCYCTAWWVPTWDGWTDRTDEQNRQFRAELFKRREYDGYLLYVDEKPVGWCQVGKRDRLAKLVRQYKLQPNAAIWAITCFMIRPEYRKKGLAGYIVKVILEDLRKQGIKLVQSFPQRTKSREDGEHWRGPENIFLKAGFKIERDDKNHPVLSINLSQNT